MRTILIADDQKEYLQTFMTIIIEEEVPYKMLSAVNGKMAVEIAIAEMPELIIMDWEMPVMNGIEAVRRIKSNPETAHIPIIIASGVMVSSDNLKQALEAGASDYLRKPIDKTEFLARVNSHLKMSDYIRAIHTQEDKISTLSKEKYLQKLENLESDMSDMMSRMSQMEQFKLNIIDKLHSLKKNLKQNSHDNIKQIDTLLSEFDEFTGQDLSHLNEMNFFDEGFVRCLLEKHTELSRNDIQLCCFLRKNMNTKDIAALTFRSVNTIKVARSKLRHKLSLSEDDNLNTYLMQF